MALYCMCNARNDQPDGQHMSAPNRYCASVSQTGDQPKSDFAPLALRQSMQCIKTGARQVTLQPSQGRDNDWSMGSRPDLYWIHYPNVDVFECKNCGARVVLEARER